MENDTEKTEEFIGKKAKVEYVQEVGWKQPVSVTIDKEFYAAEKVIQLGRTYFWKTQVAEETSGLVSGKKN